MNIKIVNQGKDISRVIINDPKTYNSLSNKNLLDLIKVFKQLDKDKGTYHRNFEGGVVREELYRKLLYMGEQRKSSKSKTRKNKRKKKRKTRKLK